MMVSVSLSQFLFCAQIFPFPKNIRSKNFTWRTSLNFAYNKGKVVKLYSKNVLRNASELIKPLSTAYYSPVRIGLVEGFQPFTLFAYRYAGLNEVGDPKIFLADDTETSKPGIPVIDDLKNMGSVQPVISGGLSNNFSYKRFSADINIIYNLGFVIRRDVNEFYTGRVITNNFSQGGIHEEFVHRWKNPGDENVTNIPAYDPVANREFRTDLNYYTGADINVIKGDFVKLRDVTLSYSVPERLINRINAKAINVRMQLNNVMIWKANDYNIDPEFYNGMGSIMQANERSSFITGIRRIPTNQHSITIGAHISL